MPFLKAKFFKQSGKELLELWHETDRSRTQVPVLKVTDKERELFSQEYAEFKSEQRPMSKVDEIGTSLEGFVKKIDDLVEGAKKELDAAQGEVVDAVGMTKDFAIEARGAANRIRGMLKGVTNSPPGGAVEDITAAPKKGLFK